MVHIMMGDKLVILGSSLSGKIAKRVAHSRLVI